MSGININVTTGEKTTFEETARPVNDAQVKLDRIAELKMLLAETDYVGMSDYDKDKTDVKTSRQAWREEIRTLQE